MTIKSTKCSQSWIMTKMLNEEMQRSKESQGLFERLKKLKKTLRNCNWKSEERSCLSGKSDIVEL